MSIMDSKADQIEVLEVWVKLDYFHTKTKSIRRLFRTLTNGNVRINGVPNYVFYKHHIKLLRYRFEVVLDYLVLYLVTSCNRLTEFKSRLKKIVYCQIDIAPATEEDLVNSLFSDSLYKTLK
jgi:hypothetical protein